MLTDHSPATRWVDAWRVSGELFCALDFTFLQGEASLPRRVVTALESRRENGKASELCSEAFTICSPDWTRTSNPSINSRMLCQLSYGGLFCFHCWFPLQRVITIPGLFGLRNFKYREVRHSLGCLMRLGGTAPADWRCSPSYLWNVEVLQLAGAFTRNRA